MILNEQALIDLVERLCRDHLAKQRGALDGAALISVEKAALRLDVSEPMIRKAIKAKRLPSYRVGTCVRVRVADVDALAVRADAPNDVDERRQRVLAAARGGRS